MIDTHCHLLAGIDDGPKSQGRSLELAAQLVDDGVDLVVCTPHYSRRFPTDHWDAVVRGRTLARALRVAGIAVELSVAAEVSPVLAIAAELDALAARSIGGRFLLVELVATTPAGFIPSLCGRLEKAHLLPILAHPERCRAVQRHPSLIDSAREGGALVQVVAPSLIGSWGTDVAATAWRLLETGRTDLLASDAHGRRSRPALGAAADLVTKRLGESALHDLTRVNPGLVVQGVHPAESPQDLGSEPA